MACGPIPSVLSSKLFSRTIGSVIQRLRAVLVILAACILLSSCQSESDPERISSVFLEQAEKAFEDRNPRALRNLISLDYSDRQNRDSREIISIGTGYIMRSRSLHLFTELESARFIDDHVHATVFAAFGARPVSNRSLLPQINADLYWFEIVLAKHSGDWRLIRASWRPAMLDDLMRD